MRRGSILLVVLALAGCASVGDLERKAPSFTGRTTKSPSEYKLCVLPAWLHIESVAHAVDTPNGFELVIPSEVAATDELLIVKGDAKGSDVSLHERMASLSRRSYTETAKACL